jgi:hypothetical protein
MTPATRPARLEPGRLKTTKDNATSAAGLRNQPLDWD